MPLDELSRPVARLGWTLTRVGQAGKARFGRQVIEIPSKSWRIHSNPLIKTIIHIYIYELVYHWVYQTVGPRFGLEFGGLIYNLQSIHLEYHMQQGRSKQLWFMEFSMNSWLTPQVKMLEPGVPPAISQGNIFCVALDHECPISILGICWHGCGNWEHLPTSTGRRSVEKGSLGEVSELYIWHPRFPGTNSRCSACQKLLGQLAMLMTQAVQLSLWLCLFWRETPNIVVGLQILRKSTWCTVSEVWTGCPKAVYAQF